VPRMSLFTTIKMQLLLCPQLRITVGWLVLLIWPLCAEYHITGCITVAQLAFLTVPIVVFAVSICKHLMVVSLFYLEFVKYFADHQLRRGRRPATSA